MKTIKYSTLPPVSQSYVLDFNSRITVLGGAIGTGKTIAQCIKLMLAAISIKPDSEGVRRTRFIVARRLYGDLEASFVKDMQNIVAPKIFKMKGQRSPMIGTMNFPYTAPDGTGKRVECEVYIYAFETAADVAKIKSLKFTAGFLIEAQEFESEKVYTGVFERLGRFPTPEGASEDDDLEENEALTWTLPNGTQGKGAFLSMDINYPESRHFLKKYLIDNNPRDKKGQLVRRLYKQPPIFHFVPEAEVSEGWQGVGGKYRGEKGMFIRNPEAKPYIIHNRWKYWEDQILELQGDDSAIQRMIFGEFGDVSSGKAVYPKFRREVHVADRPYGFRDGMPVHVGVDNGFNNAWVFCQQFPSGEIYVIRSICNVGEEAKTIKAAVEEDILPFINHHLPNHSVYFYLDQAFFSRDAGVGSRQVDVLNSAGFNARPCPEKTTKPQRDIVDDLLAKRQLVINPDEHLLIDGMAGGFNYPLNPRTGLYKDTPNQESEFSHPVNALEFVCTSLKRKSFKPRRKTSGKRKFDYF